jgi:hypothetical protein
VRFTTPALLALALAACGDAGEPLAPGAALPAGLAPQHAVAGGHAKYDTAAANVVVDDLLSRVLPTLTAGAARDALRADLEVLAGALVQPDIAALRAYVDAVKASLRSYGKTAPSAEQPELEGFDFSLDKVSEGLPEASGKPGKR